MHPTELQTQPIRIAALYRFASISDRESVRDRLETVCRDNAVLGTLLVAHEGINGTIAGPAEGVDAVLASIRSLPGFEATEAKMSAADSPPFHRLKVRIKAEIVTMDQPDIDPVEGVGAYVAPQDWNALISDPGTVVIDTRNDYEGEIGAFAGAVQPNTRTFREFADWFRGEGRALLDRPEPVTVAMYCTGGIRCEKATAFLKSEGVADVRHLHGGVLRYLETVPEQDSLWQGECFVFDERVSVGHGLSVGDHSLCRACRMPVSAEGRASPLFVEGVSCARCHADRTDAQRQGYAERQKQVALAEGRGEVHIAAALPPSRSSP